MSENEKYAVPEGTKGDVAVDPEKKGTKVMPVVQKPVQERAPTKARQNSSEHVELVSGERLITFQMWRDDPTVRESVRRLDVMSRA